MAVNKFFGDFLFDRLESGIHNKISKSLIAHYCKNEYPCSVSNGETSKQKRRTLTHFNYPIGLYPDNMSFD